MSLYKFTDINSRAPAGRTLPAEAVCIDGKFLENEVAGYTTLQVTGRELYSADIEDSTIKGMSGSKFLYRTYPARTITVKYQLRADSNQQFRTYYNKLNTLLNKEQVEISFNDEPDKYFVGSPKGITEVDGGVNTVVGEFEIYCTDPCKYSSTEKEFTATDGVLNIVNEGTVPVSIDYEVQTTSETGYIGIVSTEGVMQYGKIEELDSESFQQSEHLVSINNFYNCADDTSGTDIMHPQYGANGTCAKKSWFGQNFLGFGTVGAKKGNASGGLRTLVIPADSNGDSSGSQNFYCYFHLIFYASLMGQTGEMCINFLTADNKLICGCNWYKTDTVGNTGHYEFWANGKMLRNFSYTTSHLHTQNPWFWNWGHCDVLKEGGNIRFFYWGGYHNYYIPEIANMKCAKIQVAFKQWGDRGGNQLMGMMGFDVINFTKNNVSKWRDIPNRYPNGTRITIDGKSSHVYVNGMSRPQDEVLGTKYFKAPVGETEVKLTCSSWTKSKPTIKARIREAWL